MAVELDFLNELKNKYEDFFLSGSDEVGRGPLAGQVVGATSLVCLSRLSCSDDLQIVVQHLREMGVTDSKKLTDKKRKDILLGLGIDYKKTGVDQPIILTLNKNIKIILAIAEVSADCIDEINILNASLLAMKNSLIICLQNLENKISGTALIDGNKKIKEIGNDYEINISPVVKGDAKSVLIGLASILAKVYRDEIFKRFDILYPGYDFANNAGYPTPNHLSAIVKLGITPIHRKTFRGVKEYVGSSKRS